MTGNVYQLLAGRTISNELTKQELVQHSLYGICGEVGELQSLYQKKYQGHTFDEVHAQKELGDLLWFIAEYCTAMGWELDKIMEWNISKLQARYPNGFEPEKSLYRKDGDI